MKTEQYVTYETWHAHKQLCRLMHDEAEAIARDQRAAYLTRLDLIIERNKAMTQH